MALALIAGAPLACSDAGEDRRFDSNTSAATSVGGDDGDVGDDANEGDDAGGRLDLPAPGDDDAATDDGECQSISETATNTKAPADILVVVDNSGSMGPGNATVQSNLNNMSSQIGAANIDARVILLSQYPDTSPLCLIPLACDPGICINPPLGSGGCPQVDSNPPDFVHIDQKIESRDGLEKLITRFSDWSPYLRPDSVKHIVVVTDDNANLSAAEFGTMFEALDPGLEGYRMHGLVNYGGVSFCSIAGGNESEVYLELINATGGVADNYCKGENANYDAVFTEIATAVDVSAPLACEWLIPEPPAGETLDPDLVNMAFDDGSGSPVVIGRVDNEADCAGVSDGWYYDDPVSPTQIFVCPQTCATIQAADEATIDIQFGCATVPAG